MGFPCFIGEVDWYPSDSMVSLASDYRVRSCSRGIVGDRYEGGVEMLLSRK